MKFLSVIVANFQWLCIFCVACSTQPQASSELKFCISPEDARVEPSLRGIWKSIGNGYLLEARGDSILLYSYTENFCYKELNDYLEGLLNQQSKFRLRNDTLELYLTDYGTNTEILQTKKDFIPIEAFPENCITFQQMRELPHAKSWQLYEESLKENYAFTRRRELKWAQLFAQYGDSLEAGGNLFAQMGQIATLTKDQHTKVIDSNGTSLQYRVTPSAMGVQKAFEEQSEIDHLGAYFDHFFKSNYTNISDSILNGQGTKVANGNIEWGLITPEVGYIHIHSFAGFLNRDFTRRQQIDTINHFMTDIITALADTKGIIVDVSFNFGGYDAAALTIASYFTPSTQFAFTSEVYNNGKFYLEDSVFVYPATSITYSKPVLLLTTDISRSAAEGFAMMMKSLPNVKHAGGNTLGTLSGMLGKSISYFYTTYSNQRLTTPTGEFYEVTGVIPDIDLEVFPPENVLSGHLEAVKSLATLINEEEL